ncbi:rhamnogalacturonan acetylesterase [Viscerimonas tarda]
MLSLGASLLCAFTDANAKQALRFDFGTGNPAKGYTKVTPNDVYTQDKGYGFDVRPAEIKAVVRADSELTGDFITSAGQPFYFSVKLPEGNYKVRVILGDKNGESLTTVRAESRRLMEYRLKTAQGKLITREFNVNIRTPKLDDGSTIKLKPREYAKPDWDEKLTLEFTDELPCVCAVEIEQVDPITFFLCGDSTVVDQDNEPWCSWGQILSLFFDTHISIANYAESGEDAKSFTGERRWSKLMSKVKKGDYVFIQFGHNDVKFHDPFGTYKGAYRKYVREARAKKCIPVIVTPMNRRNFDENGQIKHSFDDYVMALKQLAQEERVRLIDLNAKSIILFNALGEEESKKAFVHYPADTFEGEPKKLADNTHFSSYGAYELAKCMVECIKASDLKIKKYIRKDYVAFNPAEPDDVSRFKMPLSLFVQTYNVEEPVAK